MRFVIYVEGETEYKGLADFLKKWLDAELDSRRVGVKVFNLKGYASFLNKLPKRAKEYLDADQTVAVIGLLDLYGPDNQNWYEDKHRVYDHPHERIRSRVSFGRSKVRDAVSHKKFRMFFAVHEIEAWILSQPELLPKKVAQGITKSVGEPEEVDFDHPPAKVLVAAYKKATGKPFKKTVHGAQLLKQLDPQIAYDKCPYLREMLDEMLKLATNATG